MIDTLSIRCIILRLAFSGKLSDQIESDGTVFDLLKQISKKPVSIQTQGVPYQIPDSWGWVRLCDVYSINPKVVAADDSKAAFVPMERISAGFGQDFSYEVQNWSQASKNHTRFENDDVAFAKISPCFENRKSFIARNLPNGIGGGTTELIILRQRLILPEYTYYLIQDQRFISAGAATYKGTVGQQRIQTDMVKNYLIPLAPYSEQKRIVDRIEQAFSVIDTIDTLQSQFSSNQAAFKEKLIDLAVRGKLTKQLPDDEPASVLLERIRAEKERLFAEGKIKREKNESVIIRRDNSHYEKLGSVEHCIDDEIPFGVPNTWEWVRLGTVFQHNTGKALNSSNRIGKLLSYITTSNLYWNDFKLDNLRKMYFTEEEEKKCTVQFKDLLVCEGGEFGRAAIWKKSYPMRIQNHVHKLRPYIPVSVEYFYYLFYLYKNSGRIGGKGIGIQGLSSNALHNLLFPLPPVQEQERIASFVNSFLAITSQLSCQ